MSSSTGRKPHGSGLGGGKSAKEMAAAHQMRMDAAPCVTECAICGWRYDGTALEGRELAKGHRRVHHPDIQPTRRRRGSLQRFGSQTDFQKEGLANAAEVARMIQHGEERAA